MNNIQLLVFDIDSTLVDRSKQTVEDSAVQVINEAREKGFHILVATGRSFFFIHDDVRKRVNTEYYVTVNGACLTDNKGNIIETHEFSKDTLDRLITYCIDNNYPLGVKYDSHIGLYGDHKYFIKHYVGNSHPQVEFLIEDNDRTKSLNAIALGVYCFAPVAQIEVMMEKFSDLNFFPTDYDTLEATKIGVDKTKTIEEVINRLGLSWDNVIAFGDGHNDIEMLEKAKVGVAMGNASDYVKTKADYVTDTVLNDGIKKAFDHLKIL